MVRKQRARLQNFTNHNIFKEILKLALEWFKNKSFLFNMYNKTQIKNKILNNKIFTANIQK